MSKPIYLFVTPFFPSPDNWRGAYCYDLAKALIADGRYDVRVFVPGGSNEYDVGGIHVVRFDWKMLPSAILPFFYRRRNESAFLRRVGQCGIKIDDIAVVHAHTAFFMPCALAVKKLNQHCLALLHHHDPQSFGLNLGRLRHFWPHKLLLFRQLREMHGQIDCHVFISRRVERNFRAVPKCVDSRYDDFRRQLAGLGWMHPVRVRNSVVLYNGVDGDVFRNSAETKSRSVSNVFTIGCIGNFIDWKDQITLIKAVERLRDEGVFDRRNVRKLLVRMIGSGVLLDSCKEYVRSHGLDEMIKFEHEVRHEMLPAFYHSLELFVLPSYFEGFGCVFTEALACGVPFITCEGQAMDELLSDDDRACWTFPPHDSAALAKLIEPMLLEDGQWRVPELIRDVDFKATVPEFLMEIEKMRVGG